MQARRPKCFPAGTLVWTKDGPKKIEDVKEGDLVWAYNHDTEQWELCRVGNTHTNEYDGELVRITIETNVGKSSTVTATSGHPFWVKAALDTTELQQRPLAIELTERDGSYRDRSAGRYVAAGRLSVGDQLLLRDGRIAAIVEIQIRFQKLRVYNLTVLRLRNYAVGNLGTLCHNVLVCKDPSPPNYRNGRSHLDHKRARSLGGKDVKENLQSLPAETNIRKGGYEGQLVKDRQRMRDAGMSESDIEYVLGDEIRSLGNSPPPRPMDPDVLDRIAVD